VAEDNNTNNPSNSEPKPAQRPDESSFGRDGYSNGRDLLVDPFDGPPKIKWNKDQRKNRWP
jgi:hypothetical protein